MTRERDERIQPYASRPRDLSRREPRPPTNFPVPNVPGGYSGGYQGNMIDRPTYTQTQQPGYSQPPPPPHQFPVHPGYPVNGHVSAIPRDFRPVQPQPGTGYVDDYTRHPDTFRACARAPDPAQPFPFGGTSAWGRSGTSQVPSYVVGPPNGGDEFIEAPERPPPASQLGYNTLVNLYPSRNSPVPLHTPHPPPTPRRHDVGRGLGHQPPPSRPPATQPYSPRVRRKRALLIGIDYSTHPNPDFKLTWGVRDAYEIAKFLQSHLGFERGNMRILTDDQPRNLPTKDNILAAMYWLVEGARSGDSLFFYFSGHATQVNDMDGDDPDGLDECICAMDYMGDVQSLPNPATPGIIVDDDIHKLMVQPLPQGCRLTAVLDCCHSGTLLDLPFIYDSRGKVKSYEQHVVRLKSSNADVISLSACKDSESAFEAREGGALRKAFIEYMTSLGNRGTYLDIIQSLRAYMRANRFRQRPQLSSSHWIDTNRQFIITG